MVVSVAMEVGAVLGSFFDELLMLLTGIDDVYLAFTHGAGVLSHPVRRKILHLMTDRSTVNREDLATAVADDEGLSPMNVEEAEILLHHKHLPKLADQGYVDYDPRTGDVVLWEDPSTVEERLEDLQQ